MRECGQPHMTEKERADAADEEMRKLREIAEAAQRELHETPQERAAREARLRRDKRKAKADANQVPSLHHHRTITTPSPPINEAGYDVMELMMPM